MATAGAAAMASRGTWRRRCACRRGCAAGWRARSAANPSEASDRAPSAARCPLLSKHTRASSACTALARAKGATEGRAARQRLVRELEAEQASPAVRRMLWAVTRIQVPAHPPCRQLPRYRASHPNRLATANPGSAQPLTLARQPFQTAVPATTTAALRRRRRRRQANFRGFLAQRRVVDLAERQAAALAQQLQRVTPTPPVLCGTLLCETLLNG